MHWVQELLPSRCAVFQRQKSAEATVEPALQRCQAQDRRGFRLRNEHHVLHVSLYPLGLPPRTTRRTFRMSGVTGTVGGFGGQSLPHSSGISVMPSAIMRAAGRSSSARGHVRAVVAMAIICWRSWSQRSSFWYRFSVSSRTASFTTERPSGPAPIERGQALAGFEHVAEAKAHRVATRDDDVADRAVVPDVDPRATEKLGRGGDA